MPIIIPNPLNDLINKEYKGLIDYRRTIDNEKEKEEFIRGYVMACCNLYHSYYDLTKASYLMAELDIKESELPKDLTEFDLEAIKAMKLHDAKLFKSEDDNEGK